MDSKLYRFEKATFVFNYQSFYTLVHENKHDKDFFLCFRLNKTEIVSLSYKEKKLIELFSLSSIIY